MQSRDHLTTGRNYGLHVGSVEMGAVEVQRFCRPQDNLRQESGVACAHLHSVFACTRPPRTRGQRVEIQVRTERQNRWAQIVERLADKWGRQIRYGGDPTDFERTARMEQAAA